jgi:cholesterol 24(S)-hydroxylase
MGLRTVFIHKNAQKENEKFDLEDMIDDFVTFFVAGQETTANSLAFCFIELARNAEIVKKLRNELDSVLGSRNIVTNEDLGRLHYLSCVVKETLRLWTPANGTVREVNIDDFKINGLHIPKNTFIHVCSSRFSQIDYICL